MTDKKAEIKDSESQFYQINLKGYLDQSWSEWLGGLSISYKENGETILSGPIKDQAALFGIFAKIQNLGLTLLSFNKID